MLRNPGNPYLAAAYLSAQPATQAKMTQSQATALARTGAYDPAYKAATDVLAPMLTCGALQGHQMRQMVKGAAEAGNAICRSLHNNSALALALLPASAVAHYAVGTQIGKALSEMLPDEVVNGITKFSSNPLETIKSAVSSVLSNGEGIVGDIASDAPKAVGDLVATAPEDLLAFAAGTYDTEDNASSVAAPKVRNSFGQRRFQNRKNGSAAGKIFVAQKDNPYARSALNVRASHYAARPAALTSSGAQAAGAIRGTAKSSTIDIGQLF